jgi:uncharacterized protein (TIRG00374 family)
VAGRPHRDWRIWLGLAVTVAAIAWTVHDITLSEVAEGLARADLTPLLLVGGLHLAGLWVRSVRWSYLTRSLSDDPIRFGVLFRATCVGFMAVNVLPFRIGELARPWLLSRETGVRATAALGTIFLERSIDFTALAVIGGAVLWAHQRALPAWVRTTAVVFAALSCVPLGLAIALRRHEGAMVGVADSVLRFAPQSVAERGRDIAKELGRGLNSLKSGRDIAWVFAHTGLLWGVVFALPYVIGFVAFGIDFGPRRMLLATYTTHALTALAIAAPAAPGFFGVYHFACRESLALFAIPAALAVAYGTLLHLAYWIPVTAIGFLCALRSGTRIVDLTGAGLGKATSEPHR